MSDIIIDKRYNRMELARLTDTRNGVIYEWYAIGILTPTEYRGSRPFFTIEDFRRAQKLSVKLEEEKFRHMKESLVSHAEKMRVKKYDLHQGSQTDFINGFRVKGNNN